MKRLRLRPIHAATAMGFTLVELMIVVVIIAVLSAIAIPLYVRQRLRGQAIEASEVLQRIVAAQEAYRAENYMYSDTSNDFTLSGTGSHTTGMPGTWWPDLRAGMRPFYQGLPLAWNQLGVRPREMVRFSYRTCAGNPSVAPNVGTSGDLGYGSLPAAQRGVWFYAQASADLDDDGTFSHLEVSSLRRGLTILGSETE